MPSETEPHERTWMAFPRDGYTLGDDAASADEARATWAAVAHAIAEFEPVTMVLDPSARDDAKRHLSETVECLEAPLDDFWMRDIGPSFVVSEAPAGGAGGAGDAGHSAHGNGARRLGAVDWIFNGWGGQDWASWEADREIGRFVAAAAGAETLSSLLVNEGGAIHVDGEGTVLVTETVQLDPGRNPWADRSRVEAELARTLGATHVIWLPRGLTRDYEEFGTRGHVDMVARSRRPGFCCCMSRATRGTRTSPCRRRSASSWREPAMPPVARGRSSGSRRRRSSATTRASSITATSTISWSTAV